MFPLEVNNLSFSYGKHQVLSDLSFSIDQGTITTILGPNGSGKTTLLKCLLGLLSSDNGTIKLYGRDSASIPPMEKSKILAYVPQKHSAAFAYNVIDVVAMGRHPWSGLFSGLSGNDMDIALEYLEKLNIVHLADRPYTRISGGEQQLVLIARALTQQANVLIMDEPVSGLDYGNQILLLEKMRELARDGITCINTSHYPEHALWTADKAIFLKKGKLLVEGEAHKIINSENLKDLYRASIRVIETTNANGPIKTCIPDFNL
ncbi:MAG: ABC transporter ATP-binding protein [Candidatus Rifleibacteriota bacterium]